MRTRKRLLTGGDDVENYWPSFTDLMAAVALILFVLFLLAYIQNLISGRSLLSTKARLADMLRRLETSQALIASSESKLHVLEDQVRASQDRITAQEHLIAQSNAELGTLRVQLEGIALLRFDVLNKVKVALEAQFAGKTGSGTPPVRVAENGNLVIAESVLFDVNSHTIKEAAKPLLRTLAKVFANLLADPSVRENVDVILVQGHTDERGGAAFNRDLSAKRASAVLSHLFEAEPTLERDYGSYFAPSAYSKFRPFNPAHTEAAYEQNRRIEISIVLKDSNVRRVIDAYIKNQAPVFRPAPSVDGGP